MTTTTATPTETTEFELSTLGTWTDSTGRRLTASYHDASTVRVDRSDKTSDVYTSREWMQVYDQIRDAGFRRAAAPSSPHAPSPPARASRRA